MNRYIELKNHQREIYYFRLRLVLSLGFVAVMLFILLLRFFYLQVIRHEYFRTMADSNRIYVVPIVPNRGLILDRNGVILARNYSAYTLEITPSRVQGVGTGGCLKCKRGNALGEEGRRPSRPSRRRTGRSPEFARRLEGRPA